MDETLKEKLQEIINDIRSAPDGSVFEPNPDYLAEIANEVEVLEATITKLESLITRLVKAIPHSLCFDALAYAEAEEIALKASDE